MNGQVLREIPVAVDYFRTCPADLYFLTHAHSDHTVGLSSRWTKKVYCSHLTAKMIHFKLGVAEKLLVPLEELESHTLHLRLAKGYVYLSVTLIPANHCPGSCMFLFETVQYRILYTGDFRPGQRIFEIGKTLWGPGHEIDTLYVDNTYCEPRCVLPTREQATKRIVEICKKHLDRTIFIGVSWTGHEDLLEAIALEIEQYVVVTPQQMKLLKLLGRKDVFTTDTLEGNVNALPSFMVTSKRIEEVNAKEEECIAILPTGKSCHRRSDTQSGLVYTVLYSNHASFSELWNFVKCVKPRKIRPVVQGRSDTGMESHFRADMSQFDCLLNQTKGRVFTESEMKVTYVSNSDIMPESPSPVRKRPKKKVNTNRAKKLKPCGVVFDDDDKD